MRELPTRIVAQASIVTLAPGYGWEHGPGMEWSRLWRKSGMSTHDGCGNLVR
jgi:hypothetical protein